MNYHSLDTQNNEGNTPIHLAVIKASTVCVLLLLKHHANLLIENCLSNSAIASCIASNHVNLLITFLHQSIDIDLSKLYIQSNDNSIKQIFSPIETKQLWRWKFAGVPTEKSAKRFSLIHWIIQRDWQGALSLILDDVHRFHLKHIQVFEAAIVNDKLSLVLCLLKSLRDRSALNETNSHGQNLFHIMSYYQRSDNQFFGKVLTYLFDNHVAWNVSDKYGFYPIHYACVIQNIPFIHFLREKYSDQLDFKQTDTFGNTAYGLLFWSSARQSSFNREFLRTLISSGQSIDCLCNYENEIPINPLSFGHIDSALGNLISYPPIKSERDFAEVRVSPLINALIHNHFPLAKFLLELGADANFPDGENRTPLIHAIRQVSTISSL
jgi:ankyrin repeat protein